VLFVKVELMKGDPGFPDEVDEGGREEGEGDKEK